MTIDAFFDTNVLVYAAYPAPGEDHKQDIALDLIKRKPFSVSTQVMLEFLNTTTRKRKPGLSLDQARQWLDDFSVSPVIGVDEALVLEGVELAIRYKIVFWDGTIIAAANRAGATTLFTEDLSHGQKYGSVQVINPFKNLQN
jgi:predicted nucleic acid-binding protein